MIRAGFDKAVRQGCSGISLEQQRLINDGRNCSVVGTRVESLGYARAKGVYRAWLDTHSRPMG